MSRMTRETFERHQVARERSYDEWAANRERNAQAWTNYHAAVEIERLRAQARKQKSEYDREVDRLTVKIANLSKAVEVAEERLGHFSKHERARRATESETVAKIAKVEKNVTVLATAVLSDKVTKAAPKGVRKIVHRDANNRITHVTVEPLP